jgi:hypothetical protein
MSRKEPKITVELCYANGKPIGQEEVVLADEELDCLAKFFAPIILENTKKKEAEFL